MNELHDVDAKMESGAMGCHADTLERFGETIDTLKVAFPAKQWETPSGKVYEGTELPDNLLNLSYDNSNSGLVVGTLLNICISLRGGSSLFSWMLASGFDPRVYNPHTRNSSIGGMAYTGQYQLLQICHEFGYDLSLLVEHHHYPEMDATKKHTLIGTTLLHRMAERFGRIIDGDKVMQILLESGVDPYAKNGAGESALEWAEGGAEKVLKHWIANLEAKELQRTFPATSTIRVMPRL